MSSKPSYRFSTTKIGDWTIEPTGSENRCILKLTKTGAEPRKVDEFSSPEAAAAAVARIETSEFAPDSHWRAKEEFDLHNWSLGVQPTKKPIEAPRTPTAIGRLSSAMKRLGGRNHFT